MAEVKLVAVTKYYSIVLLGEKWCVCGGGWDWGGGRMSGLIYLIYLIYPLISEKMCHDTLGKMRGGEKCRVIKMQII